MIKIITNFLNDQDIETLLKDIKPKENGATLTPFDNKSYYGFLNANCSRHPIAAKVCLKLGYELKQMDLASIKYYPLDSSSGLHSDNCRIDGNVVTRMKPWNSTVIVFLNDNFEGGELYFPNQGAIITPKKGMLVETDAGIDYIHGVNKITKGERFSLILRII